MKHLRIPLLLLSAAAALLLLNIPLAIAQEDEADPEARRAALMARVEADIQAGLKAGSELESMGLTPCVAGFAGPYPCDNVDLLAFLPLSAIGGGSGNDIWGWTDPQDGKEYAIMGRSSGTSFVDISDPENPVYLGNLPTHSASSSWRDIKVYANHAFVVSEAGAHGMQVFDLTRLRSVPNPPVTFSEDAHFAGFGSAHNIVINEDSGYAYAVGAGTCAGGLHFIDIQNPLAPADAGCFSADGYTHDAQCVNYSGPDPDHQGSEICFAYNEDTVTVVDVSDKGNPQQLSRSPYSGSGYTHQGWLSEDQSYLLQDDELDEASFGHNTRTRIWDVSDLDNPILVGFHDGPNASIDHNLYIHQGYAYEANYTSGLEIYGLSQAISGTLVLEAFFDIYTPNNSTSFNGAWSNYPYYASGVVVVSGMGEGLFVLRPILTPDYAISTSPESLEVCVAGAPGAAIQVDDRNGYSGTVSLSAVGLPAGSSANFQPADVVVPGSSTMTLTVSTTPGGVYGFNVHGTDGSIEHDAPMSLTVYDGVPGEPTPIAPADGALGVHQVPTFVWSAVPQTVSYHLEVAGDPGFSSIVYSADTAATSQVSGQSFSPLTTYYWRVRGSNLCGPGAWSQVFSFTTRDIAPVLLVDDDDNTPDVRFTYTGTLDALGVAFDIWDTGNSDNEPGSQDLAPYESVVWFTGNEFGGAAGPGAAGESSLAGWLDSGGCLFISSQDYLYDRGLTSFMNTYLGLDSGVNDLGFYSVVSGAGAAFSGLGPYNLSFPFSDYSDVLTPGNAQNALVASNGKVAGISKDAVVYKTVFLAMAWEGLPSNGRMETMQAFLDWCDQPPPVSIYLPLTAQQP